MNRMNGWIWVWGNSWIVFPWMNFHKYFLEWFFFLRLCMWGTEMYWRCVGLFFVRFGFVGGLWNLKRKILIVCWILNWFIVCFNLLIIFWINRWFRGVQVKAHQLHMVYIFFLQPKLESKFRKLSEFWPFFSSSEQILYIFQDFLRK